jgi:hypothetical protein
MVLHDIMFSSLVPHALGMFTELMPSNVHERTHRVRLPKFLHDVLNDPGRFLKLMGQVIELEPPACSREAPGRAGHCVDAAKNNMCRCLIH